MMSLSIQVMSPEQLKTTLDWAKQEGWNPGLSDPLSFQSTDPTGYFMAVSPSGENIGSISAVRYPHSFGFIGLFIVSPPHRNRGIGTQLQKQAYAYLEGCTIGLDGVVAKQKSYQSHGFVLSYRNIRFEGTLPTVSKSSSLIPAQQISFSELMNFDTFHFGTPRKHFLIHWILQPETTTLVSQKEGMIEGFGTIRPCHQGYKIGPLFCKNEGVAETILMGLGASVPPHSVIYLDVPEPNPLGVHLAEKYGFKPMFETARMYKGPAPQLPLHQIYGVTTFELG